MPGKNLLVQLCGVILQYGLLFFMYLFLYRILRLMYADFRRTVSAGGKPETNARRPRLVVMESGGAELAGNIFPFTDAIRIGRSSENDIVIDDSFVSHRHAFIRKERGGFTIEDLSSVNHTYLNDEMLRQRTSLQSGDMIRIGLVTFKFER